MRPSGTVLVVIGQIGAGKSAVCRELVSLVGAQHLDVEDLRSQNAGPNATPTIAEHVASVALSGPTVFECTGASRDFEDIIEHLRLRGLECFVVFLDCGMRTAMRRIYGRALRPRSGGSWASQLRWTESRLRFVPADLTLSSETSEPGDLASAVCHAWEVMARGEIQAHIPKEVSFSQLAAFEVCPKSYKLKYADRAAEVLETEQMYLGSRLHEALAWLYAEPGRTRDRTELLAWFQDRIAETLPFGVGEDTTRRLFEAGRKALVFHHDAVYRNERTRTIGVEKMVRMKLGRGATFVGRVDRIAVDASGTVEAIDYKASQRRCTSRPRIPDGLQTAAYGAAVLLELDLPSIIARRTVLATGEEERFALMAGDVRQVTLSLRRWLARLAAGGFPPRVGPHCASCQFNPICDEGARFPATRRAFVR